MRRELSQMDVARYLGLQTAQSVSDWERNYGSSIPIPALKKLVRLYGLSENEVFEMVLEFQYEKLKEKLEAEFYTRASRRTRR